MPPRVDAHAFDGGEFVVKTSAQVSMFGFPGGNGTRRAGGSVTATSE
jgi:hypothetical protein